MDWNLFAGPAALAVAASMAVYALWKRHIRDDEIKEEAIKTLTAAVGEFPAALKDLTEVVVDASHRERTRPHSERAGDR